MNDTPAVSALFMVALFNIVFGFSLSQIWGMINGLQLAAYLSLINIKIPLIAGEFCSHVASIVTFDIPDVTMENLPLLGSRVR